MKTNYSSSAVHARRAAFGLVLAFAIGNAFGSDVDSTDKSFIKDAYQGGVTEVEMGQMGLRKTANADVKAFAERIISDHTAANGELKSLADSKKVAVPTDPGMVDSGKMKLLDAKSGNEFDKAYVDGLVTDHQKDIQAFQKEATEAKDADVKAFVNKTLPTLKAHLEQAEAIQRKIGQ